VLKLYPLSFRRKGHEPFQEIGQFSGIHGRLLVPMLHYNGTTGTRQDDFATGAVVYDRLKFVALPVVEIEGGETLKEAKSVTHCVRG
jgi:hypothetical protein